MLKTDPDKHTRQPRHFRNNRATRFVFASLEPLKVIYTYVDRVVTHLTH